ncbi:MAG: hypothetical protein ACREJR_04200 [Candidatus Rokuibacteriota bacterium]
MSVQVLFDRVEAGEAVLRLEPSPDELWRKLFEEGLADAVAHRVRLAGDRLLVEATPKMLRDGRLNGAWTDVLALRVQAANEEWKRRRDNGETELPRPRRPGWRLENGRLVRR